MRIMDIGTIGIIGGTGKQGSGLAKRWLNAGFDVIIGSRLSDKGEKVANQLKTAILENNTVGTVSGGDNQLAANADIIVLAIPADQVKPLIFPLIELLKDKIVFDLTVNVKFGKFPSAQKIEGTSVYEYIRDLFPQSKIVSCFKTISASSLASKEDLDQVDFQMTTHDDAIATAHHLSKAIGLRPVRVRGKNHAFTMERMVALAIQLNKEYPGSHVGFDLVKLKN